MIYFSQIWGLLALLSIPLIVLLYTFRPRRQTLQVSSNRLWREALRARRSGHGLQKLLRDLSLVLLLLFALLLALALAGMGWSGQSTEREDIVLVIDTSASMQARAASGSTRLQRAREQARQIIAGLDREARILLISSGRNAVMRTAFEADRSVLAAAVDDIQATDEAGNPRQALTLAVSLLRNRERGKVYFITDGAFDRLQNLDTSRIEFRVIEGAAHNVAITRFDFRPEIGSEQGHQVLVTVRNYVDREIIAALGVELAGQRLFNRTIELGPLAERTLVLPLQGHIAGPATAILSYADDFAQDNKAYAVIESDSPLRILLLSRANIYLESAFSALPNTVVDQLAAPGQDFAVQPAQYDVVVLDQIMPPPSMSALPPGNYLLIDVVPPGLPVSSSSRVTLPQISGSVLGTGNARSSAAGRLFSQIDLSGLAIDRARQLEYRAQSNGVQALFWSRETDLALALLDAERRAVLLGFSLQDSNFPLLASFPLFLGESLAWLSPRPDRHSGTQVAAGEAVTLYPPAAATELSVQTPAGLTLQYPSSGGRVQFADTAVAGFYRYTVGAVQKQFAVNLSDEQESDIRSRTPGSGISAPQTLRAGEGRRDTPLWPLLVMCGLLLLLLEWLLWCWRGASV